MTDSAVRIARKTPLVVPARAPDTPHRLEAGKQTYLKVDTVGSEHKVQLCYVDMRGKGVAPVEFGRDDVWLW